MCIRDSIRCLRAAFRKEENLTHRDFLGSLMGMGIVREKIGDILVGPDSADVLVLDTCLLYTSDVYKRQTHT